MKSELKVVPMNKNTKCPHKLRCFLLIALFSVSSAFIARSGIIEQTRQNPTFANVPFTFRKTGAGRLFNANNKNDNEEEIPSQESTIVSVSWPYAAAWIGFIAFSLFGTPDGLGGEASKQLIDKFIQNPLNPGN